MAPLRRWRPVDAGRAFRADYCRSGPVPVPLRPQPHSRCGAGGYPGHPADGGRTDLPGGIYHRVPEIPADHQGLDCGEATIELFKKELQGAKTVVWNGPAGVFEVEKYAKGTKAICEVLANLEGATTIIGGGDSAAAAISMGYESKFSHISTGGGASLEYLEGKALPGVVCLDDK